MSVKFLFVLLLFLVNISISYAQENTTQYNITEMLSAQAPIESDFNSGEIKIWWEEQTVESILLLLLAIAITILITAIVIDRLT